MIATLLVIVSFGCSKENKGDLLKGRWKMVKFFINDNESTEDCNLETYLNIYDEEMLMEFPVGCYGVANSSTLVKYRTDLDDDKRSNISNTLFIEINGSIEVLLEIRLITKTELETSRVQNNFVYRYAFEKVK